MYVCMNTHTHIHTHTHTHTQALLDRRETEEMLARAEESIVDQQEITGSPYRMCSRCI